MINVRRQMTPDEALAIVKRTTRQPNLTIMFCRDYGDSFVLFLRSGNESPEAVARNGKVINKETGRVSNFSDSDLNAKDWTPRYDYGGNLWPITQ